MSYEGEYGPDETCPHDSYWRNCKYCSHIGPQPTEADKQRVRYGQAVRKRNYLQHPEDAKSIHISEHTVTLYKAQCPHADCTWRHETLNFEDISSLVNQHIKYCEETANMWRDVNPEEAYVEP